MCPYCNSPCCYMPKLPHAYKHIAFTSPWPYSIMPKFPLSMLSQARVSYPMANLPHAYIAHTHCAPCPLCSTRIVLYAHMPISIMLQPRYFQSRLSPLPVFLLEINIYPKLFLLFCLLSQGAHTFNVGCNSANPYTLRVVHLPHSHFLTFYILLGLFFKPLLLNVFLSLSVRDAVKAAQGAHIRLKLWSDH